MSTIGDIIDVLFYIALCALCAVSLFTMVRWFIDYKTEKEKALVGSRESLAASIIAAAVLILLFFLDLVTGSTQWLYLIAGVCELAYIPAATFTILTPNGICRSFSLKKAYVPTSDLSYEFGDRFLAMFFTKKAKNNMVKYHIGINKKETVKMLADWYPKHDYKNPILPDDNNNEGE